jgi:hypothetical protein
MRGRSSLIFHHLMYRAGIFGFSSYRFFPEEQQTHLAVGNLPPPAIQFHRFSKTYYYTEVCVNPRCCCTPSHCAKNMKNWVC